MSSQIRDLQPSNLWNRFADLNSIPRPSKHEEKVCAWIVEWAKEKGLEVKQDQVDNIIIKNPATPGMEDKQIVVLQSHVDMVCQKNNDTDFDFMTEGIKMYVDGDWVRAEGTTLGADNGIGVAAIMAVLESTDIPHPQLEALFTIDEETGMTGALGLQGGHLDATILLNLDTEDDDEISIGCAGGVDLTSTGTYEPENTVTEGNTAYKVVVKGGSGGHSGMDIHKGIANANKLLNRVLLEALESVDLRVAEINGGGLRNAIPREAEAVIVVASADVDGLNSAIEATAAELNAEYKVTDPELTVNVNPAEMPATALPEDVQNALLLAIQACPVGIHRMSPDIEGLVQTSNNLARVDVKNGSVNIQCLNRSSVDSEKWDHARSIEAAFSLAGLSTEQGGAYPGWTPNPSSAAVEMLRSLYVERYNEDPRVLACHAGLECGILGTNYPDMDMASFGPNIRGAHSPDECVQISSVQKFWDFFLEALKRIPNRA
ncbi:MAG: cytosol nonspecific dipeptidase [Crocinitomicaceae bacterium]|nr:cytosol nonspecific dipeptidase [Crocinitomicaceae bacterium]